MKVDNVNSGMKVVVFLILASIALFISGLFFGYIRDTFWQPPGDSYSVMPKAH